MNTDSFTALLQAFKEELVSDISQSILAKLTPANGDEEERWVSPEVARNMFDPAVTRQTLHSWAKKGVINSKKFGNQVRYKRSEILKAGATLKKYRRAI